VLTETSAAIDPAQNEAIDVVERDARLVVRDCRRAAHDNKRFPPTSDDRVQSTFS
jgi:hypothetical protein